MPHITFQYLCFALYQHSIWKLGGLLAGLHFQEKKVDVGVLIKNTGMIQ